MTDLSSQSVMAVDVTDTRGGPSRSTERRSVVVDGSSIQGCVTLHRGGLTLHRGDIYLHGVVVRAGYPQPVLGRIDLHWNV